VPKNWNSEMAMRERFTWWIWQIRGIDLPNTVANQGYIFATVVYTIDLPDQLPGPWWACRCCFMRKESCTRPTPFRCWGCHLCQSVFMAILKPINSIFPITKQSFFPFVFSLILHNLELRTNFVDIIFTPSAEFVKAFAWWCDTSSLASRYT